MSTPQTALVTLKNTGLNLRADPKTLPPGQFQSSNNITSEVEGSITPRRGRRKLGALPAGATLPHSAAKLSVFPGEVPGYPGNNPRYIGEKSDLYRSKTLASGSFVKVNPQAVCTAPTGLALSGYWSLAAYRAGATGEAWAFLAGELAMLKDYGAYPMGAATTLTVAGLSGVGASPIVIQTTTPHGLAEGDTVIVGGIEGVGQSIGSGGNQYNAANGIFPKIHILDPTHFSLPGTTGNAAYSNGGKVTGGLQTWGIRPANGVAQCLTLDINTASAATPIIVKTNVQHGLEDHSPVTIAGVVGNAAANGSHYVKIVDELHVALYSDPALAVPVAGLGAGTSGYFVGVLDGGDFGSPAASISYKYVYTYRNPLTGNEGNPSQLMLDDSQAGAVRPGPSQSGAPLPVNLRAVVVHAMGTDDPQIPVGANATVVFYRTGGLLTDGVYRFVGYGVNPGLDQNCGIFDNVADTDLVYESRICEFDNDPPVPSTLRSAWVTTLVGGPYGPADQTGAASVVAVREAPPASLRPGSLVTFSGLAGTSSQEVCIVQAIGTAVVSGVTYPALSLYLQYQHLTGERIECGTITGQPCALACSAFDSTFLAGDPNNPDTLYKSKTGQPESFPIIDAAGLVHAMKVGTPANPIMAIAEFRGNILCLNAQNLYEISVFNGVMYGPNATPAQRGLLARRAWCVADNEIWYLAYDGLWSWGGGESVKRSDVLDPIFHGRITTFLGQSYQPINMDPGALQFARLEYARKQVHFFYRDASGVMVELVYDCLFQRWEPGSKNGASANQLATHLMLERDTGNLLYLRQDALGGVVCLDDMVTNAGLASDEYTTDPVTQGSAIPWSAVTGWLDLGNAFVPKVFDEVMLESDPQGPFTVKVYYDYSQAPGDTFTVGAAGGRAWLSLQTNLRADVAQGGALSSYGRQASVICFQFSGSAQGYRPVIFGLKFRYREIGEITAGPVYDWSDLGHKYDKRLYEFTVEFDTGNTNQTLILDTIGGVLGNVETDDVQSFPITNPVILGPGRAKCTFPIKDGVVCKLVRLRAVSTAPGTASPASTFFRLLAADFQKEDYPADIVPFCEPQDDGYPYLKYLNQFNIDVDTAGQAVAVQIQADGATVETVIIQTTAQDRDRTPTINPNLMGRKWRWLVDTAQPAIAVNGGKFQVFSHSFKFQPADKGEVVHTGDWDDLEHKFDKRLYTVTLEWDNTGGAPVTIVLDLLSGISGGTLQSAVQTFDLGTAGRSEKTFALVDGLIAKKIRLYPQTSPLPKTFRHWKYYFQKENYPADTVLFTEWEDGGNPYLKYLNQLTLDVDTNGQAVDVQIQVDGGATVQTITVNTTGTTRDFTPTTKPNLMGRRWRLCVDPNQAALFNGTGKFQLFGHAFKWQPADKGEVGHTFDWDDLGWPFDKRLETVTIEWDNTGNPDVVMQMDLRGGIGGGTLTSNAQQFVITGGRSKRTWAVNDRNICKLVRIYPLDDTTTFRQWKYSFEFIKYPADTVVFTDNKDFEWPYEKIAKVLDIKVDTGGTDAMVNLVGDSTVKDTFVVNTTLDDWRRVYAVRKDQLAKLWKLEITPDPAGKFQLFEWNLLFQKEPPYISYWRSYEQTFGYAPWKLLKQFWVEYIAPQGLVVTIDSDTGQFVKVLPAHTARLTERFLLPSVFGAGLNKSKTYIITLGSAGFAPVGGPSMQFGLPNDFAPGTVTLNIMVRVPYQFTRLDWNLSADVGSMPTGQDAIFDLQISSDHGSSWASIFPPGTANKLVVPAGGPNYGTVGAFSRSIANQGDWIKVVCLQAGSGVPGKGLQGLMYGNAISAVSGPLFKVYPGGSGVEWLPMGVDRHTAYQKTALSEFWMFDV